jgi:putative tryptophan/tyrosine transport system substrate-binding protein
MRTDAEFRRSNWALAMRELGWVEGQNVVFERRGSDGRPELLPGLAQELVQANVDVIATFSSPDTVAAKQATSSIPIVMIFSSYDPVAEGLITSFARPGGNITGVSRMLAETDPKRLELIKEMLPVAARVGVLDFPRQDAGQQARFEQGMRAAARNLRVELQFFAYRTTGDLDAAIPAMVAAQVQAFVLEPHFLAFRHRERIAELALKHRLPGVFTLREYVEAGGLMSYGPDYPALERQHARYVDRVLRGAKPADLPIEQPTKFELAVNLKTAKALSITPPQSILLRADAVMQ